MSHTLIKIALVVGALAVTVAVGLGSWCFRRRVNFGLSYRDQVRAEIRAAVRPECLLAAPDPDRAP